MHRSIFLGLVVVAGAWSCTFPATAQTETRSFRAHYSVTLMGLPIGKASFDSTFTADSFRIDGKVASSGVGRIFDRTNGTTTVEGRIGRDGARPSSYVLDYTSGKKTGHTAISYAGVDVKSVVNLPEPKKRENWVPITDAVLRAATDPLTSTLIRATDPREVCDRTIRFFDGELRADLKLSHRATGPVGGFPGGGVTCDARFVPVAGYREGRKQIEHLKNESRITIAFTQLADTGFYTPVDASIGTRAGTVRVTASSIEPR